MADTAAAHNEAHAEPNYLAVFGWLFVLTVIEVGVDVPDATVIVIEGALQAATTPTDDELRVEVESLVAGGASRKDAVSATAAAHGTSRRRIYNLAVNTEG